MSAGRRTLALQALSGLVLAAVPTVVAATSTTVQDPSYVSLVAIGVLLTWAVGMAMWTRPHDRWIARMLFVLATAYAVRGLAASDNPWVFSTARALGQVAEFVLVWIMLAFPSGRLRSTVDRVIVVAGGLAATVLWIPAVLVSVDVPLPGVLVPCGTDCPTNALLLVDHPGLATALELAFRVVSVLVLVAAAGSLTVRLVRATPLARRTLAPLMVASIVRTLAIATFVLTAGAAPPGRVLVALFWAIPLSMALGLMLGRFYVAAGLQRLVSGLQHRPDPAELRSVIADTLDDPGLEILYWLPDQGCWVDTSGRQHPDPPDTGPGRVVSTVVDTAGVRRAALVHDVSILEQPALLEAVTASTRRALEENQAVAESALLVAEAQGRARREIERDLHDGAQQRLIALRMKVSVLARLFDQDVHRAEELAGELGPDIDATLDELRRLAHGRGPRLLTDAGLAAALTDLVGRSPVPATLSTRGIGRYPPEVESAVFFVCVEALQNAAKHGGPGVRATIDLEDDATALRFTVADHGQGAPQLAAGEGLGNMRTRVAAVGGELAIRSVEGAGVRVRGEVPLTRLPAGPAGTGTVSDRPGTPGTAPPR